MDKDLDKDIDKSKERDKTKDKVIFVTGVSVISFALGWLVDEIMFNHSLKTHMSKEASIYLAAMDYVRAIRNGEE